ncbi:hypothetical protein BGZ99_008269 [Dissophora globulifera]|uniref:Uncharacterized protein n=1 Tax=Dissophora globulifera TaxID=979702 RepID=A0A9P6UQ04_9FUNG|nr:hypothetical protein BGZ99_008269 [Dissophora globulifera]
MRFSTITAAIAAVAVTVTAAPLYMGLDMASTPTPSTASIDILNFALTLEHLEAAFYNYGYDKFDDKAFTDAGFDPRVRDRIGHIMEHENDHVTTLSSVITSLGGNPVPACTYNFPVEIVPEFLAIAQALETTGVSAYTGAIDGLDGDLLTAAGTIATVEGRHSYFLNVILGQSGFPYAFDTPLSPRQIITIATSFIQECPFDLGLTPYTHLTATLPAEGSTKVTTSFQGQENYAIENTWCQFLYGNHLVISPGAECTLPPGAIGYVYVFVTSSKNPVNMPNSDILAGPALLFNGSHNH